MTVNLVQANNGTPALPVGSSMLYALQQCKLGAPATAAGGGGAAGIVIPGLEGITPGNQGSANDIAVNVSETIHTEDSPSLAPGVFIGISETIHTSDRAALTAQVSIVVNERVHVTDGSPALLPGYPGPLQPDARGGLSAERGQAGRQGARAVRLLIVLTATRTGRER